MFYAKLAFTNIRKNGKYYYPYIITCVFTIAMYYIMCFVAFNQGIGKMKGSDNIKLMMNFGSYVVAIFSFVFLVYANSFLMKRRKREFGLYNILGLEKRHIGKIMFFETIYVVIGSLVAGIVSGIIFSRLVLMIMGRMLDFDIKIGFDVSIKGIGRSIVLFIIIFAIILIGNLVSVRKTNPIELLNTSAAGEREPKAKFMLTLVGIITLAAGYGIAIRVGSPLTAFNIFFIAVLLVVVGTYCIFISGSITLLKMLKKNKKYYYKSNHFTSVSGMIYRMKKNAAGLASICILSTMVLVVISTTVSLYVGEEDALKYRYPFDLSITKEYSQENLDTRQSENDKLLDKFLSDISNNGMETEEIQTYEDYYVFAEKKNGKFEYMASSLMDCYVFEMVSAEDYEKLTGDKLNLAENEVIVYSSHFHKGDTIQLGSIDLNVADTLKSFPVEDEVGGKMFKACYMVLADKSVMESIYLDVCGQLEGGEGFVYYNMNVNLKGSDEEILEFYFNQILDNQYYSEDISKECRQMEKDGFYMTYGGLLFLGIFLGLLFLIITVLIIYYKQITEEYEDKQRFEIMQKVGMSEAEVRKSIRSQILTVFMLPIVVAACHVAGAFKMITKLLAVLNLINVQLFVICTICTILIFVVVYVVVYVLTSKVYYRIIKS